MTQRTAPAGPPAGPTGGLPPDPAPLFELAVAYWRSAALFAALDLAVFEAVDDTPRSPAELATALKLPPRPLSVLLEALAALGLLERTSDDHYRATPLTRAYLRRGGPAWLGDAIAFNARSYPAWGKLAAAVRADTPAQPPAQILGADPAATRNFVLAMHGRARGVAACLAALLDLRGCRRLLDLGGGPGTYSALLAERYPDLHCTVLDLPPIVAVARDLVGTSPARERLEFLPGDLFRTEFGAGYDAVLISGVLHRTEGDATVALLRRAAAALVPGGLLAVSDLFTGGETRGPVLPELFSLHMLLTAESGRALRLPDFGAQLAAAGLRLERSIPLPPPLPHTLVLARRPA